MKFDPATIHFPKTVSVTEQTIDISSLSERQRNYYIWLFSTLVDTYEAKNRPRCIFGLAGAGGSGKSVIAALLSEISKQVALPFRFEILGIDAFHFRNDYLLSHPDGDKTLKDSKGRFDTYDVEKLYAVLRDFTEGKVVSLPHYSRKLHEPVEDAATIGEEKAVLLVEGLWLLYDKALWQKVIPILDYKMFVDSNKDAARSAVIERHIRGGRSLQDAMQYYDSVDAPNAELVATTSSRAEMVIPPLYKI